jgi:predicted dehydrogenase
MNEVLLVGAGPMAQDYFDVLSALGVMSNVVCQTVESADAFERSKGSRPMTGGVADFLQQERIPEHAIISVGVEHLVAVTNSALCAGVKSILIEKPAGLFLEEIESLNKLAKDVGADVYVAYNRRFYSSVSRLIDMAKSDGGIKTISFDFTEWSDKIAPLKKGPFVKERWVLSNSTHVIDLAFFLAGKPRELSACIQGSLGWHKAASSFVGSGITENDILFSYRADWNAPGRWGLAAFTENYKLELLPLEGLLVTQRNTVQANPVEIDDDDDKMYKPGLMSQVTAFLNRDDERLCSLEYQCEIYPYYTQIAGYKL